MIKKIFVACLLLLMTNICLAADRIELYVGEIKILKLGNIERIAVGSPAIVSNSMLNDGQLILIAEGAGSSNVHIWFNNGTEKDYMVHVTAASDNLVKRKIEVENLLGDIEGLEIDLAGDRIVLSGLVEFGHEETIKTVQEAYPEVLVSINFAINSLVRQKQEVEELLSDVDGLNVRIVGNKIVLNGLVDTGHVPAIDIVIGAYPEVMNLTQTGSLDMDMPDNKMVMMAIKITEFNKNFTETLGISWQNSVAGPSAAFALDGATNSVFRPLQTPSTTAIAGNPVNLTPGNAISPLGYFGIAFEIASRINFAVGSGNAVILAEPRLAVRSGGEASFHAGGEFPIEISNINGTTVEFKQFGIKLSVKPNVDRNNNVRALVETELSAVDRSVTVNNIPGLLTRTTSADVILASGETLVMSGLINQEAAKDISGLKFLSEIPILGELFKSKSFADKKTELVIFVTPTVFDADSELNKKTIEYAREGIKGVVEAIDEDSLDIVY
jgi:pilus assembly protein CpaC